LEVEPCKMAWGIVGHDWAVDLLHRNLAADRLAHAYLFSGPPQIGKTSLALALAQAVNCLWPDPPCGHCASCQKIGRQVYPDLHLIVGEGAGGSIKIEQVRALRREAVLAPYEGRYRVAILRQLDRASTEAANSLLKLLEEPPRHMILVVTAATAEALPATIVSRCQRVDLRPVAPGAIEAALRERGLAQPKASLLAGLSGGRVGWALAAMQEEAIVRQRRGDLDDLVELLEVDRLARLDFASKANRDSDVARRQIEQWTLWWRDLLLLCGQVEVGVVNTDRLSELRLLAGQVSLPEVVAGMRALRAAAEQLEANVNARLALEGLLLGFPRWRGLTTDQVH
jgi:DNA polymerase-3 subunit delta'